MLEVDLVPALNNNLNPHFVPQSVKSRTKCALPLSSDIDVTELSLSDVIPELSYKFVLTAR